MESYLRKVDEWVRDNIYNILQANNRWIALYPVETVPIICQLTESYIQKFHRSNSKWHSIPPVERSLMVEQLNSAVSDWLARNYRNHDRSRFREVSEVMYDPAQYPDELSKAVHERGGVCNCDDGCGEDCSQRARRVECSDQCNSGANCGNKESRSPVDWSSEVKVRFISLEMGVGVFAEEDIASGSFIGVVTGEAITEDELAKRLDDGSEDNHNLFGARRKKGDPVWAIDASQCGNFTRFVNSSCQPNVGTIPWVAQSRIIIKLVAVEDISAVSEKTSKI